MNKPNLVPLEVLGVSSDAKFSPIVLLKHEDRVLPILVGLAEADSIGAALTGRDFGRPMTHDLICNLLAGLRGELKSVVIYKLENDTFFAHLNIEQRTPRTPDGRGGAEIEQVLKIDSRPSDGIAIACRVQCPIFAAQEVMDQASTEWSLVQMPGEDEDIDDGEEDEDDEESGPGFE
jgi:uncharacterized protein